MVKYISVQRDFTHGEMSPLLNTRTDKEFYYKSCSKLRNMLVLPQGSATRRFGTDYRTLFNAPIDKHKETAFNYSETLSYLLVFVPEKILVYKDNVLIKVIITDYSIDEVNDLDFTQTKNQMFIFHKEHPIKLLFRGTLETDWTLGDANFRIFPTWDFRADYYTTTFTLASVIPGVDITLTATDDVFYSGHVGGLFLGFGDLTSGSELGRARITDFTDSKNVKVTILTQFSGSFTTPGVLGQECELQEVAWSDDHGYPQTGTFYSGRLVTASTKELPETMFMSVENDYLNFDEGVGEPDDAIVAQIASDEIATILYVVGDTNLQIFTVSGEYASRELEAGFELGNFVIRKQPGSNGTHKVRPVSFDNSTVYVRRGGQAVMAFSYVNDNNSYNSVNISTTSAHLINNPISMGRRVRSKRDDADFLFVINEDGTMAVFQSVIAQKVQAWSLCDTINTTNGKFRAAVSVGDDVYFIVDRNIAGATEHYIEKLNFDVYTDSSIEHTFVTPTKIIGGLSHLEQQDVRLVGDGYAYPKFYTVSGGQIVLDEEDKAVSVAKVGLDIIPELVTFPIVPPPNPTDFTYIEKRIINIFVEYYQSNGIYVQGKLIPERHFDDIFSYPPLSPETGNDKINFNGEFERRPTISITQKDPLPMTIVGIGYELDIGGQ